jgi:hypothetical protein
MLYRVRAYWVLDAKQGITLVNFTGIYDTQTGEYGTQAPTIGVYRQPNALTGILDRYAGFIARSFTAMFVWRYGFWVALMLISMTALILNKRFAALILYLPVFVYLSTLYMTNGWTDYRYGLPVFLIAMFLPAALLLTEGGDKICRNAKKLS